MPPRTPLNVALLGFGNVGRSFAEYIGRINEAASIKISIRAIADSSGGRLFDDSEFVAGATDHKKSGQPLSDLQAGEFIGDARDFIRALPSARIPILVESLPSNLDSGEPALSLLTAALEQGTSVVTV